jgi:hypothetical protein
MVDNLTTTSSPVATDRLSPHHQPRHYLLSGVKQSHVDLPIISTDSGLNSDSMTQILSELIGSNYSQKGILVELSHSPDLSDESGRASRYRRGCVL